MASILLPPGYRVTDANGNPVSGAKLYFFDAGTTDAFTTYQDNALGTAHAHPIVCDSGGMPANSGGTKCLVYTAGGDLVKIRATTSADVTLWEFDNYPPYITDAATVPVASGGTGATTAANARTNLGAASASDLTTLTSTVTTISGERSALPGGSFGNAAGLDLVTPEYMDDIGEICVQRYFSASPSTTSLTTTTPADSTVPLVSEGTEIFTTSFTPLFDNSRLVVEAFVGGALVPADGYVAVAAYAGSTCIGADATFGLDAGARVNSVYLLCEHSPGATSAITLSVRAGPSSSTTTINTLFGTAARTWFRVREYVTPPTA